MDKAPRLDKYALEERQVVLWRRAPQVVSTFEVWFFGVVAVVLVALGMAGQLWALVSAVLVGAWLLARGALWLIGRRGLYQVSIDLENGAITLLDVRGLDAPRRAEIQPQELASILLGNCEIEIWWLDNEEPAICGKFAHDALAWSELKAAFGASLPLAGKISHVDEFDSGSL